MRRRVRRFLLFLVRSADDLYASTSPAVSGFLLRAAASLRAMMLSVLVADGAVSLFVPFILPLFFAGAVWIQRGSCFRTRNRCLEQLICFCFHFAPPDYLLGLPAAAARLAYLVLDLFFRTLRVCSLCRVLIYAVLRMIGLGRAVHFFPLFSSISCCVQQYLMPC